MVGDGTGVTGNHAGRPAHDQHLLYSGYSVPFGASAPEVSNSWRECETGQEIDTGKHPPCKLRPCKCARNTEGWNVLELLLQIAVRVESEPWTEPDWRDIECHGQW